MQNSTLSVQNYIAEAFGSLYTEGKSFPQEYPVFYSFPDHQKEKKLWKIF